ncbi:MAG TPA: hypothetical protein PLO51_01320, partial [Candidatus Micrarchaeota archaeon]|nr:hypothetical protein [Candidatus Micrarchaeota archaeon]
ITDAHIIYTLTSMLSEKKETSVDKALAHLEIWKKIDSELFLLIVGLIQAAKPPDKYMKRLENFLYPSTRTVEYIEAGYVVLTWRRELNRSLFWLMPDASLPQHPIYDFGTLPREGLPIIVLYDPSQYQNVKFAHDMIELEFPRRMEGIVDEKMLEKYLPPMASKWKQVKSVLPGKLQGGLIFRAKRPPASQNVNLVVGIKQMSHNLFNDEQVKIVMELLAKSVQPHPKPADATKPSGEPAGQT